MHCHSPHQLPASASAASPACLQAATPGMLLGAASLTPLPEDATDGLRQPRPAMPCPATQPCLQAPPRFRCRRWGARPAGGESCWRPHWAPGCRAGLGELGLGCGNGWWGWPLQKMLAWHPGTSYRALPGTALTAPHCTACTALPADINPSRRQPHAAAAAGHAPQGDVAAEPFTSAVPPLPCSRFMHTRIEKEFETEDFLEGATDAFHTGGGGVAGRGCGWVGGVDGWMGGVGVATSCQWSLGCMAPPHAWRCSELVRNALAVAASRRAMRACLPILAAVHELLAEEDWGSLKTMMSGVCVCVL